MSENTFTRNQMLIASVIKKAGIGDNSTFIVLNTDTLTAFEVKTLADGLFSITGEWKHSPERDFFSLAAELFAGGSENAEHIFEISRDSASVLERFLKRKQSEEHNAVLDETNSITCKKLTDLYKESYEGRLKSALKAATDSSPSVDVYPVGRLAAFYPALHSVKEMLSAMPFVPAIPFLKADKELFCDTEAFEAEGRQLLEETEKKNRSVKSNVFLILKKLTDGKLENEFCLLASQGASFTDFTAPTYGNNFLCHKDDSLSILAGNKNFSLAVPSELFPANTDTAVISLAPVYDGEKLMISFRSESITVKHEIDKDIYS